MTTLVLAVGISVLVSSLCSLLEAVLYSTRSITLEARAQEGEPLAARMGALKKEVERPLSAILIFNTLANTAGAAVAGWAAAQVFGAGALWVFSLVFTLTILVLSEIIPKTVGAVHWRGLWRWTVLPISVMVALASPLIWFTRVLTGLITRGRREAGGVSEEEILAAARLGEQGGQISKLEEELIRNIILLENVRARDIMTPRTVMFTVDGDRPLSLARKEALGWSHSRAPVVRGGPEDVVGYVIKDQVAAASPGEGRRVLADLARPVRYVPASANALNLLNNFLRRREHIYLVVDEFGGIMGLVTLEDVLESLVGSEIVDEDEPVADLQDMARRRARDFMRRRRDS